MLTTNERHVIYCGQTYVCRFDERGCYVVYHRRLYAAGRPWEAYHNYSCWHLSMGMPSRGKVFQIIELAKRQVDSGQTLD